MWIAFRRSMGKWSCEIIFPPLPPHPPHSHSAFLSFHFFHILPLHASLNPSAGSSPAAAAFAWYAAGYPYALCLLDGGISMLLFFLLLLLSGSVRSIRFRTALAMIQGISDGESDLPCWRLLTVISELLEYFRSLCTLLANYQARGLPDRRNP